jgi:inorganic pyrophosphatase
MNYLTLPIGSRSPDLVYAVVEVPLGEVNKYEYDPKLGVFRLDRPLYSSVHYPGEYGFVPSTLSTDGDPLDILVLTSQPSFSGCVIEARVLGVLDLIDQGVSDAKVLAVGAHDPQRKLLRNFADLEPHLLREIEHFFSVYKELEGKRTTVIGWRDVKEARSLIMESHRRFQEQAEPAHASSSR